MSRRQNLSRFTFFAATLTFSGILSSVEKDELAKVLAEAEGSSKSYAAELEKERSEVSRLKAELEKVKEEHKQQITRVTDSTTSEIDSAKAELADREKALRTEIETLK